MHRDGKRGRLVQEPAAFHVWWARKESQILRFAPTQKLTLVVATFALAAQMTKVITTNDASFSLYAYRPMAMWSSQNDQQKDFWSI
jgi:hypothetical protein